MNERRLPRTENEIGISRNLCILSSQRAHGVVIAREIEKLLHRATLPLLSSFSNSALRCFASATREATSVIINVSPATSFPSPGDPDKSHPLLSHLPTLF